MNAVARPALKSNAPLRPRSPAIGGLMPYETLPGSPFLFAVASRSLKTVLVVRPPSPANPWLISRKRMPGSLFLGG
jgi:hypothetical protein